MTKETETVRNRLRLGVGVLGEGCKKQSVRRSGRVGTSAHGNIEPFHLEEKEDALSKCS